MFRSGYVAVSCLLTFFAGMFGGAPFARAQATARVSTVKASVAAVSGTVTDTTGAIIAGAQVALTTSTGATVATAVTDATGGFRVTPPAPGIYTLMVTRKGFQPFSEGVSVGAATIAPLTIQLGVATAVQKVTVNANSAANIDLTNSANNGNTSVMTAKDLNDLPIFDNNFVSAMGSFLDQADAGTAGTGLMVDGVEASRAMVSPSAVQEIIINQDPYSAQYYWPGRGQMDIITKQATDKYHGEFNFTDRNSVMDAQQKLAPTKPDISRLIFEGDLTGPLPRLKSTMFLFSFQRNVEDQSAVVNATVAPTTENPLGIFNVNVPTPERDTEFSIRVGHQISEKQNASLMYAFEDGNAVNQGVGGQTLPEAGYNTETREDDLVAHDNYILSANALNEAAVVLERRYDPITDVAEGPQIAVSGDYVGGSAQNDQVATEYEGRLNDVMTWTMGRQTMKFGFNVPHLARRVFEDRTNRDGTYNFGPTYDANGKLTTTALQNQQAGNPSAFSVKQGQSRFVYHEDVVGGFFQDQIKFTPWFSLTPGLRYDWQNFLGQTDKFSPRASFAWVWDQKHALVLRGGGGVYYDRTGNGPLLDLARYSPGRLRLVQISSKQQPLCFPASKCVDASKLPSSLTVLAPNVRTPYIVIYGLSLDRRVGQAGTVSIEGDMNHEYDRYRSVDINAPLPPDYSVRPNSKIAQLRQIQSEGTQKGSELNINYRGRFNKRFTGFAWYSWSHFGNNTSGFWFFPENQYDPNAEWGPSDWSRRNHFGLYGAINPQHLLNLGVGIFANSGSPYSILTGADNFGTSLFNARPAGVPRNSEIVPDYADLDLRWGYNFKLRPKDADKSPTVGLSVASFNMLNHPNGGSVDNTEGSTDFGQVISYGEPRRMQLGLRMMF